ncbi:hypothetical protein ABZS66_36320 [Dactylosporangium sp. NPDC005572]|uniref:hypothetical protein n=1 Tax=Dactylosporangium sp. NPDC005572 TaxID=3156889 RepID=UPI0033B85403
MLCQMGPENVDEVIGRAMIWRHSYPNDTPEQLEQRILQAALPDLMLRLIELAENKTDAIVANEALEYLQKVTIAHDDLAELYLQVWDERTCR